MSHIVLTSRLRFISLVLILASIVNFLWFVTEFTHFINIPILKQKSSLVGSANSKQSNHLFNASLYLVFWLQHLIMSTNLFKRKMSQLFSLYPVFERYIFNNVASLLYICILRNSIISNQIIFSIPFPIYVFTLLLGNIIAGGSSIQLGSYLLMPFGFVQLFSLKQIEFDYNFTKKKKGLNTNGFFKLCRNPIQAGTLLLILSTPIITYDRLLFVIIHVIGIVVGVLKEQAYLEREYQDYKEYKEKNPNRFLPNLINVLK